MKKLISLILVLMMALSLCVGVMAYDRPVPNCSYADADGNGICDNCTIADCPQHHGRNYTDADNDGVCDSCPNTGCVPKLYGHHGHGGGHHGHKHCK